MYSTGKDKLNFFHKMAKAFCTIARRKGKQIYTSKWNFEVEQKVNRIQRLLIYNFARYTWSNINISLQIQFCRTFSQLKNVNTDKFWAWTFARWNGYSVIAGYWLF